MKLILTLLMCLFFLGVFPPSSAVGGDIDLTIEGGALSARLKGISLKIILEKLEKGRGIWFKGNSSLLEEEITVQFTDLPIEKGLQRILASVNYSLVFDGNERLVGVIVISKGTADHAVSEGTKGTILSPRTNERADVNRSVTKIKNRAPKATAKDQGDFTEVKNYPRPGGPEKGRLEEPENLEIIRDVGPPGGRVEVTIEERENFKAVRNCPPPDGPVKVSEGEPRNFEVISDIPPPGGPVEISEEELESFKVIENCPPPGS
jgi:hypothetical protein